MGRWKVCVGQGLVSNLPVGSTVSWCVPHPRITHGYCPLGSCGQHHTPQLPWQKAGPRDLCWQCSLSRGALCLCCSPEELPCDPQAPDNREATWEEGWSLEQPRLPWRDAWAPRSGDLLKSQFCGLKLLRSGGRGLVHPERPGMTQPPILPCGPRLGS